MRVEEIRAFLKQANEHGLLKRANPLTKLANEIIKEAIIKQEGQHYVLYTRDKTRVLGRHKTMADALKQERAIQASKMSKKASNGHHITKCSCGNIISQCRCMGPHEIRVVENGCDDCKK